MAQSRRIGIWWLAAILALVVIIAGTVFVVGQTRAAARAKAARTAAEARRRASARPFPPQLRNDDNQQLLASVPRDEEVRKPFLAALLDLKEREGRDNAMIHYVVGGWSMPEIARSQEDMKTTISQVLEHGWGPHAETLRAYLAACQAAFPEIRKGAALNHARGIGFDQGAATPVPNFLTAMQLAKALCLEGRLFESEGRTTEALANYLTVVTMGRDYTSTGSMLISGLIGYSCENIGLRLVEGLVADDRLDLASLEVLLGRLREIEKTHASAADALAAETAFADAWISQGIANPDTLVAGDRTTFSDVLVFHDKETLSKFWSYRVRRLQYTHNLDRLEPDLKAINAVRMRAATTPWWDLDTDRYRQELYDAIAQSHPVLRDSQLDSADFVELRVRHLVTLTRLRACQLSAAVMAWKKKHGALPPSLEDVRKDYFPTGLPIDPFSGKSLMYSVSGGKRMHLASTGPDKIPDAQAVRYDPTNGTLSRGDIALIP